MYIKSMVLDGFKSYGKRIEINDFDKEFNAITGFNGSGKSNILDAICFVLGITNLEQVRAGSLQDLVYKSGQAGVKAASVTVTFDNRDRALSPLGYENHQEITVTRQVVIGGKNKYIVNGVTVANNRVHDMFCSVQLNVNNPHFLIMQGRITKVLNMKPMEILLMIEEAAGTRMYETKKETALKTIEKKDSKLKEINDILNQEIGPRLAKLKEEKTQFVEFQRIQRELEHCKRISIAWRYLSTLRESEKAEQSVQKVIKEIESKTQGIAAGEEEIKAIEEKCDEILKQRDAESGVQLAALEQELKEAEKKECKLSAAINGNSENIKAAEKSLAQLRENISDDGKVLAKKEQDYKSVEGLFDKLKGIDQQDSEALVAAQEKYQKISSGLLENEAGENATLEQQLISAKQSVSQAQTELKQCEMALQHNEGQLKKKTTEMKTSENEYKTYSKDFENKEKEAKNLQNKLSKLSYDEGNVEQLKKDRHKLSNEIRTLREDLDKFESRYPQTRFDYHKPRPNFNPKSVRGLVCKLITVKDKSAGYALDIAAGGKLYNVIVDTEKTSKDILTYGKLEQCVTIIPLNKVQGRPMDNRIIKLAQQVAGPENVQPALSLIDFPEDTRPAMTWIFGQIFICKDMDAANKVAFHNDIRRKCVTLEGDVVDPFGTLSGGAPSKTGSILLKLEAIKHIHDDLKQKQNEIRLIEDALNKVEGVEQEYMTIKEKFDLTTYELGIVKQRLQQTVHHKIKEEIENLRSSIEELKQRMDAARKAEQENSKRADQLQNQLKDATGIRNKQLKQAENELTALRKKAENSRKEWQKREQEAETLKLEIQELQKTIEGGKEQLVKAEENLNTLKEKANSLQEDLNQVKASVKELQKNVKEQKNAITKQNAEMQKLVTKKEDILKQNKDAELEIKKLNHEINTVTNSAKDCQRRVAELQRKYEWIEEDKAHFGQSGSIYDFEVNNPEEMEQKVQRLQSTRESLSRNVNARAISLLDKKEEQFNEMMKKKRIVESDKKKILEAIKHFDEKKKETLVKACNQVNKDFGSIFSSLLPGANAKLQPPENQTVLEGVEIKVGFSGVWKESLGELSGGQRSLVALSLILAMLLFKPAPLYILDEVDAALDLSHTENIGIMLKKHFKHSQFIVVSLKDGMFTNANVVFTTKFVDGMSTITRKSRK